MLCAKTHTQLLLEEKAVAAGRGPNLKPRKKMGGLAEGRVKLTPHQIQQRLEQVFGNADWQAAVFHPKRCDAVPFIDVSQLRSMLWTGNRAVTFLYIGAMILNRRLFFRRIIEFQWRKKYDPARAKLRNHNPVRRSKRLKSAAARYWNDPAVRAKASSDSARHYQNNKARRKETADRWISENRDRYRKWMADWQREKRRTDPQYNIGNRLRSRLWHAVTSQNGTKAFKTEELIGCTVAECRAYIQTLFTDGMSWELLLAGEIVLDHVIPCAAFDLTKPEEQKKCFHFSNVAPAWDLDNQKKGDKLPDGTRARHLRNLTSQSIAA